MGTEESITAPPRVAWSPRGLGAVAIATIGVVWTASGILELVTQAQWSVTTPVPTGAWVFGVVSTVIGLATFFGSNWIAARVLASGPEAAAPDPRLLLSALIAIVGLATVVAHLDALVRVALPFTAYDQREEIPLSAVLADVFAVGLGVFLFVRSGTVAGWWTRWSGDR